MNFTEQDYQDALEVFTIKRVKERLVEDQKKLCVLLAIQDKKPTEEVVKDQRGITIYVHGDPSVRKLNIRVLKQNIEFWNNILHFHEKQREPAAS